MPSDELSRPRPPRRPERCPRPAPLAPPTSPAGRCRHLTLRAGRAGGLSTCREALGRGCAERRRAAPPRALPRAAAGGREGGKEGEREGRRREAGGRDLGSSGGSGSREGAGVHSGISGAPRGDTLTSRGRGRAAGGGCALKGGGARPPSLRHGGGTGRARSGARLPALPGLDPAPRPPMCLGKRAASSPSGEPGRAGPGQVPGGRGAGGAGALGACQPPAAGARQRAALRAAPCPRRGPRGAARRPLAACGDRVRRGERAPKRRRKSRSAAFRPCRGGSESPAGAQRPRGAFSAPGRPSGALAERLTGGCPTRLRAPPGERDLEPPRGQPEPQPALPLAAAARRGAR